MEYKLDIKNIENGLFYKVNNGGYDIGDNAWIFHHTDSDGMMSGLVGRKIAHSLGYQDDNYINMIKTGYYIDFNKFDIQSGDLVIIMDLSFSEATSKKLIDLSMKTKNIIWIDHHKTSNDMLKDETIKDVVDKFRVVILGGYSNKYSACLLGWYYYQLEATFHPETFSEYIDVPEAIYMVSDWDTWVHEIPESAYLNKALNIVENNLIDDFGCYDETNIFEMVLYNEDILKEKISEGKLYLEYDKSEYTRYIKSNSFEYNLLGYNILASNRRCNSLLFGDKINEYDIVCPFVMNIRNGKPEYTYSLFTANKEVDCSEIAKLFGGGGHKGAAGFSTDFNIFELSKRKLRFKIFINKIKNKFSNK